MNTKSSNFSFVTSLIIVSFFAFFSISSAQEFMSVRKESSLSPQEVQKETENIADVNQKIVKINSNLSEGRNLNFLKFFRKLNENRLESNVLKQKETLIKLAREGEYNLVLNGLLSKQDIARLPQELQVLVPRHITVANAPVMIISADEENQDDHYFKYIEINGTYPELLVTDPEFNNITSNTLITGEVVFLDTELIMMDTQNGFDEYDVEYGPGFPSTQQDVSVDAIERKTLVIPFKFQNQQVPDPTTVENLFSKTFGSDTSTRAFFEENSYGDMTLVGVNNPAGDVTPWVTIASNAPTGSSSNSANCSNPSTVNTWSSQALEQAQNLGFLPANYDQFVFVFPFQTVCNTLNGFANLNGMNTFIHYNIGVSSAQKFSSTTSHEIGHNLGLYHSNSLFCTDSSGQKIPIKFNQFNLIDGSCLVGSYGNVYDVMGNSAMFRHFGVKNKGYPTLGFLESDQYTTLNPTVPNAQGGIFTVSALSQDDDNLKFVRVQRQNGYYYYISYRSDVGFDGYSTSGLFTDGPIVEFGRDFNQPNVVANSSTVILDMTPETTSFLDARLPVGQSYYDEGIDFYLETLSFDPIAKTITFQIEFTENPEGPTEEPTDPVDPTDPTDPTDPVDPPVACYSTDPSITAQFTESPYAPAKYLNVSITHPLVPGMTYCPNSQMLTTLVLPGVGWTKTPSSTNTNPIPGNTATSQFIITPPPNIANGSYPITVTTANQTPGSVSNPNSTTVVNFIVNNTPPPPSCEYVNPTLSVDSTFVSENSRLYTVSVQNPSSGTCTSSIVINSTVPSNWTVSPSSSTVTLSSGATGQAVFTVTKPSNVTSGQHMITFTGINNSTSNPTSNPLSSITVPFVFENPETASACTSAPTLSGTSENVVNGAFIKKFTILVTNTSPSNCGNGTFDISATVPNSNWGISQNTATLTIAPGQTKGYVFTVLKPVITLSGTHNIVFSGQNSEGETSNTLTLPFTVTVPPLSGSGTCLYVVTITGSITTNGQINLTVSNPPNQPLNCNPTTTPVIPIVPYGWSVTPTSSTTTIPPASTTNVSFTISLPSDVTLGTYSLPVVIQNSNNLHNVGVNWLTYNLTNQI